jgi:ligand-binding sensor domain-containing protein
VVETFREGSTGLPSDLVQALADVDGTLWVGTREGLVLLRPDGTWERLPGLPPLSITALRRGTGDTVWVGTSAGLLRVVGTRFEILDRRDGLVNTGVLSLLETTSAAGDRLLWVGTDGGGLAIFGVAGDPQLIATFGSESEPPIPNDVVSGLAQGPDGSVWVASNRGVAELTLTGAGVGFGPPVHVHSFGTEDGLPALASNRGALLLDRGGRLWVGTVEGTAYLEQGPVREEDRTAKRLVLRAVMVDGAARRLGTEGLVVTASERNVVLDFALLSYFREQDTRYRTQLVGLEAAPAAWQVSGRRELTGLAPGKYTLEVQGRDFEGNLSRLLEVPIVVEANLWNSVLRTAALPLVLLALGTWALVAQRRRRDAVEVRLQAHADLARAAAERTRDLLARCGLVDTASGLANDVALGLLADRPVTTGAALVLLGLRDRAVGPDEAAQFEVRAAEILAAEAPVGTEVGRFESGVAWAWLPASSAEVGRALASAARGRLAGTGVATVCAVAAAGEPTAPLPDRAAEALGTARRTGLLADG